MQSMQAMMETNEKLTDPSMHEIRRHHDALIQVVRKHISDKPMQAMLAARLLLGRSVTLMRTGADAAHASVSSSVGARA